MSGIADCLRAHPEGICLQVKAVPKSSQNQIGEMLGDRLKVRITAPPVDSAANEALIRFLAKTLGLPKSDVQLIRGQTNRNKTFLLKGSSVKAVVARLGE